MYVGSLNNEVRLPKVESDHLSAGGCPRFSAARVVPGDAAVPAEHVPVLLLGGFQFRELEGCCFADSGDKCSGGLIVVMQSQVQGDQRPW